LRLLRRRHAAWRESERVVSNCNDPVPGVVSQMGRCAVRRPVQEIAMSMNTRRVRFGSLALAVLLFVSSVAIAHAANGAAGVYKGS
jgi:hypothetical protein